jgi:hypothetical protein
MIPFDGCEHSQRSIENGALMACEIWAAKKHVGRVAENTKRNLGYEKFKIMLF